MIIYKLYLRYYLLLCVLHLTIATVIDFSTPVLIALIVYLILYTIEQILLYKKLLLKDYLFNALNTYRL